MLEPGDDDHATTNSYYKEDRWLLLLAPGVPDHSRDLSTGRISKKKIQGGARPKRSYAPYYDCSALQHLGCFASGWRFGLGRYLFPNVGMKKLCGYSGGHNATVQYSLLQVL